VAGNRGNKPVGVPEVQANLWAERDASWLEGLTLTAGAIHTGSQYVNQANTQKLDDWTRFDVGARYTTLIDERPTTFAPPCRTCSTRRTGRAWPPTARSPKVHRALYYCRQLSISETFSRLTV
jgi:hypothetical protein